MTQLLRSTPVLRTSDYARSRAYYTDVLGYRVVEEGGNPARFGIFQRDQSMLFINGWDGGPGASPGGWDAYVHVSDLDALYQEMSRANAEICRPIEATSYGMREFEVKDPDGNVVCFGHDKPESG